ncbi:hypothetical protein D3C71_1806260 [compost metagenome]
MLAIRNRKQLSCQRRSLTVQEFLVVAFFQGVGEIPAGIGQLAQVRLGDSPFRVPKRTVDLIFGKGTQQLVDRLVQQPKRLHCIHQMLFRLR